MIIHCDSKIFLGCSIAQSSILNNELLALTKNSRTKPEKWTIPLPFLTSLRAPRLCWHSAKIHHSSCEILPIEMVFKCQTDSYLKEFATKVAKIEKTDDGKVLVSFDVSAYLLDCWNGKISELLFAIGHSIVPGRRRPTHRSWITCHQI